MFIVSSYSLAVVLCVVTMLCWGSWGNTQKFAGRTWRYELFYWDYVIGIFLFSILMGFTFGSFGPHGRSFVTDLCQAAPAGILSALIGGIIFNASNILLSASTSISGMSVAFPLGVGLALVLGVINTYATTPHHGNTALLFLGVALVVIAIVLNGIASGMNSRQEGKRNNKGIWLAIAAGVLMSLFYPFVAGAMDLEHFVNPTAGKLTPYSAFFVFATGILLSNFLFNTIVMRHPFVGTPVSYKTYFAGSMSTHCVGALGGVIWGLGTLISYISAGKAGASISYALGQGAPMIAALWGVFIWKEFKGGNKTVNLLLVLMFLFFIAGLSSIVISGAN